MNVYKPEYKIPLPEKYKIGDANPNNGVWKRGLGPDKESKSTNPIGTKSEGRRQVTWKEAGKKRTGILSQDGDGVLLPCERYRCEFTDNGEIRRRLTLFSNERKSMEASEKIKDILSSAGILGGNLGGWFEQQPKALKDKIIEFGLIKNKHIGKPLSEHLEAFQAKVKLGFRPKLKGGCTDGHVRAVTARVERIVKECEFMLWGDIDLDAVQDCLTKFKLSDRTHNYYVRDFMQFVNWMLKAKRADFAPGGELPTVECEDDEDKRAFTVEEMEKLIKATHAGPERQGLKGYDRAVLYLITAETGFRMREMATLKVGSFDLDDCSVSVERENAKDRRAATIPLRAKRTKQLREYFKGRDRDEQAFDMHKHPRGAEMIRADLETARKKWLKEAKGNPAEYKQREESDFLKCLDSNDRKGCFHSLRVTFITNLDGTDASIAERKTLARHSMRGDLTLGTYTKIRAYNLKRVVEQLPDLPWPGSQSQSQVMKATGTDGRDLRNTCQDSAQHRISADNHRRKAAISPTKTPSGRNNKGAGWTHNPLVVGSNPTGPSTLP